MAIYYRALRKHITMYVRSEIKRIYSDTSKLLTMRSHRTITNYAQYLVTWYEWIEPNERMKNYFEFFGLDCGKYLIGFHFRNGKLSIAYLMSVGSLIVTLFNVTVRKWS